MKFSSGPGGSQNGYRTTTSFRISSRDAAADRRAEAEILAAAQAGDMPRAAALAERALAGGLETAMILNLVALRFETEGRLSEALIRLHRARQLAPRDVGTLNALGLCLLRLERPAEALEAFDALLAVDPRAPFGLANRGQALHAIGRLDRAEAAYREALAAAPGHPVALSGLASIASQRGAHAEASGYAARVLEREPGLPGPSLALAKAELAAGRAADAEARMAAVIADPRPTDLERADAWNLVGEARDARDDRTGAFEAYRTCNELLKSIYSDRFAQAADALDYARRLAATLKRVPMPPVPPAPATGPARSHVFLLGFPRSGTTLLEAVLAGSPDVATLEEQEALADGVRAWLRNPDDLSALAQAGAAELDAQRSAYWTRVREAGVEPAGKVFIDRYPLNTLKLPLIRRLFPEARILFAVRDPRDVLWSCYRRRFQMSAPMYQLLDMSSGAAFYDAVQSIAQAAGGGPGQRRVRHEDLLADFEGEARSICDFIGLQWRDEMRDISSRASNRTIATPSTAQIAGGLSTDSAGRWRAYEDRLAPALPVLAPWAKLYGYPED